MCQSNCNHEHIIGAVQAVMAVEGARKIDIEVPAGVTFFSGQDIWLYDIREDDKTCEICRNIADQASLMGGFNGNSVRSLFPFYQLIDVNTIKANSHMPRDANCRCLLTRYIGDPAKRLPAQKHLIPTKLEPDKELDVLPRPDNKWWKDN